MEEQEGTGPATPSEGKSELGPIAATVAVKLTFRGEGEPPTLADLTKSLTSWDLSGNGLTVSVTSIERTDR